MDKDDINKILSLSVNDKNDFYKCFTYIKNYLENIKEGDFYESEVLDLKALINKFIQFGTPIASETETLIADLEEYSDKLELSVYKYKHDESPKESDATRNLHFQHTYSNLLKLYTQIDNYFQYHNEELLDFDGLINYDISNKRKAINLIYEAIELIEKDNTLSEKSKKKILKYLSDTIQELTNPKTNWSNFFKKTAEVVIVLGALGSLTGGVESGSNLLLAKNKVETAKEEIKQTSINLNYLNVENTFNFNNQIEIENNKIIMLEQNNKK